MPTPNKRPVSRDERLSELIRFKRLEQPDAAFWERFEHGFRSKQLASLVQVHPWHERIGRVIFLAAKKSAPASAATAALVVTFFVASRPDLMSSHDPKPTPDLAIEEIEAAPVFAMQEDAANAEPETLATLYQFPAADAYHVRVISSQYPSYDYELHADPVSLKANPLKSTEGSALGAHVILSDRRF